MKAVLLSTYELGRQPFGLASPAAWMRARGHEVRCVDLSVSPFPANAIRDAGLVAFYLPMHTATRLAARAIERTRGLNEDAHLAAYGLYAPLNAGYLGSLGVKTVIGGEFEAALASLADSLASGHGAPVGSIVPLDKLTFLTPDRTGMPAPDRYARLITENGEVTAGSTEASRGCKHRCRHCPVVPVYQGAFRVVQREVVLADIRQQVAAGARHITFGDPDFFNGPRHAMRIAEDLHREFPEVTYDVTIKIEHLLKHREGLPLLKATGCLFVTSAVESVDDAVLGKLEKGHTRADFYEAAALCRSTELVLNPTFIAFLPWTTKAGYLALLSTLRELHLEDQVSPVQLALRLLIPAGSRLLELEEVRNVVRRFDESSLVWTWEHADPEIDRLAGVVLAVVRQAQRAGRSRREIFAAVWETVSGQPLLEDPGLLPRAAIPYLNEPWYC